MALGAMRAVPVGLAMAQIEKRSLGQHQSTLPILWKFLHFRGDISMTG
jgi:hypothetical protein